MKEILVSEPSYVTHFNCIGAACRDHCCKRWNITVDKATYKKYLKSEIPNIRKVAQEEMLLTKKNVDQWALIKFNEEGNCSFFTEDSLCYIHKVAGPKSLSHTCSSYPRTQTTYKNEELKSLNLSCPESVRHILFNEQAMNLETTSMLKSNFNQSSPVDMEGRLINLFCANLMMQPQNRVEENLYAIIYFIIFYQKITGSLDEKIGQMENAYESIVTQMASGALTEAMGNVKELQTLELQLLLGLQKHMLETEGLRGQDRLLDYMIRLNNFFGSDKTEEQLSSGLSQLKKGWDGIALHWLNQRPYIMRNYFQYRLYHDQFGMTRQQPLLKEIYLIVVDYFFIKSLLSAAALEKGYLTDDDLIDVMYSYSTVRQHDRKVNDKFSQEIDRFKRNDDLSVLNLLV